MVEAIKQGYQQTEIGVIPEDWDVVTFDEAFKFLSTATYSRADLTENDDVLYIHYGDIHTKWNHFLNLNKYSLPSIENAKAKKYDLLIEGDIVMADASEDYEGIGKSVEIINIGDKKIISGLHTFLLRDKSNFFVHGFRGYICSNKIVKDQFDRLATGLKVYGVSKRNLKVVQIPQPSEPEQRAIAQALSETDELITSLSSLIAKKKNIKQGAMQELLTGKKRLPGFEGEWDVKKLAAIAEMSSGGTPLSTNRAYYGGNIPWVIIADMTHTKKYLYNTEKKITEQGLQNSPAKIFKKGTLLFAMYASIGKCSIARVDVSCNQAILGISTKRVDTEFLYYYLSFNENTFLQMGQTGTQNNLNKEIVQNLDIPYPPIKEQSAIAQVLSDMDLEIEELEEQREKYLMVKQGMMQELLTGRIRLL